MIVKAWFKREHKRKHKSPHFTVKTHATHKHTSDHYSEAHFSHLYLCSQVFKQTPGEKSNECKEIAQSILKHFPEFHAFKLRPPSSDPEVVSKLNTRESSDEVSKLFIWGIDGFKRMLNFKLSPKRSFSGEEFVTGEGESGYLRELVFTRCLETTDEW